LVSKVDVAKLNCTLKFFTLVFSISTAFDGLIGYLKYPVINNLFVDELGLKSKENTSFTLRPKLFNLKVFVLSSKTAIPKSDDLSDVFLLGLA
jgi:hypothetical protein